MNPEMVWLLRDGRWVAGCPACGSATQRGFVLVGGSRWVALANPGRSLATREVFAARVGRRAHVLWVCQNCGEVVS